MGITPGTQISHYSVLSQLGAGGMGEVYRANDPRLGRDVALKVIRRAITVGEHAQDDAIDRLMREAVLASALNHPNIVTIYETGVFGEDRYIAMELVDGITLRKAAAQGLPVARTVGVARQVSEALAVAHAAQIVHRDIKPDNVMLRPDGYIKLLDFGLARIRPEAVAAGSTGSLTERGFIQGTVAYMAPEQARGDAVAPEADVFALGVVLYELVTGKHPFAAASPLGTLHALLSESPEHPSLLNPELPRAIDQLIMEMLQKEPRLRPGASEVMYRLGLAHDSTIVVALSEVAVSQRRPIAGANIVGRDAELDVLQHEFERAKKGAGRLVVVSAEAGLGKTTLVDAFLRQLEERDEPLRVGRGRCSERLAGSEAYLPVVEAIDSLQRSEQLGSITRMIRALAPSWYVQIMPSTPNDSSAARLAADTAVGSQERLKREMESLLEEIGRLQPIVLWFDDVHWADPSTTDLIGYLARRIDNTRLLMIATCRPSDLAQGRHPFLTLKLDLLSRGMCREVSLGLLDRTAIARYLALQFPEHAFPDEFATLIQHRTEGNPLFMSDLLKELRRRQVIRQLDGRWILTEDVQAIERELPQSVRSFVQRKIEILDDGDRKLLGAASIQGHDFDTAVLAGALRLPEEDVEDRLERLEREHALVRFVDEWEGPDRSLTLRYRFAHHVYHHGFQETLRATRRVALSRAIAERLVHRVGDAPCDCAADIAILYEGARENLNAARYWNRAAEAAARLHAHDESARLARRGLDLLAGEPPSAARAQAELALQMTFGLAAKTSRGYAVPEVGDAYARARELSREIQDPAQLVPVLMGLSAHHIVSGEIETSRDVALEMHDLANRLNDSNLQMLGNWALGAALFHLGDLHTAHAHLLKSLDLYSPAFHRPRVWVTGIEPGIFARCELSRTLIVLGYPDQGLAAAHEAVAHARALEHPQPYAFALLFEMLAHMKRRESADVLKTYAELETLCTSHGIAQELQWAAPLRGRALFDAGHVEEGLDQIRDGLAAHTLTRSSLLRPFFFNLFAGALIRVGRFEEAQAALDESDLTARATSQHAFAAEHARLMGEMLSVQRQLGDAEAWYRKALRLAHEQGARWLELRAVRGFAHFLLSVGRTDEAREVLDRGLAGFTEGAATLDVAFATALRDSL